MREPPFRFSQTLPPSVLAEIALLEGDGYVVHKEWRNGIELRKGKRFREWLLSVHVFFPALLFPGYMRSVIDNLFGYRHRVLVTLDECAPRIIFV